jgi:hypothetical protein
MVGCPCKTEVQPAREDFPTVTMKCSLETSLAIKIQHKTAGGKSLPARLSRPVCNVAIVLSEPLSRVHSEPAHCQTAQPAAYEYEARREIGEGKS